MSGRVVAGCRAANRLKPPLGWRHAATPSIPGPSDPTSDRNQPQEQRKETRPSPRPVLQAPAPTRRQSLRPRRPAQMAPMETYRSSHRPVRHRIQRAIRASEVGDRAHDVMAVRLPQTQSPLRAPAPQLPGISRTCRRPLLLQAPRPPHHVGHDLRPCPTWSVGSCAAHGEWTVGMDRSGRLVGVGKAVAAGGASSSAGWRGREHR